MCGIIGYAGPRNAQEVLLDGLKRLEYRGYDSAGVAIVDSSLEIFKDKGEISKLASTMPSIIGHILPSECLMIFIPRLCTRAVISL